jgi:hypothetical protein
MGSVSVHRHAFGKSRFPPPGEGRNTTRETELVKAGGRAGKGRMVAVSAARGGAAAPQGRVCRAAEGNETVQQGRNGLSALASGRGDYRWLHRAIHCSIRHLLITGKYRRSVVL